jgi:hypothetical protein
MDVKIDYLSFTLPINLSGAGHNDEVENFIAHHMDAAGLSTFKDFLLNGKASVRGGRGHYGHGLYWEQFHISLWFGGLANHVLFEVAGVGCQALRDADLLLTVLSAVQTRATRIDVAVDLPDAGKPADFVSKRKRNRFRAHSSMESVSGWTEYIGSMKASRYARVYLYAEPHPRAGVMRVEHVLRDEYAKSIAAEIVRDGLASVVSMLGNTFGWEHERWQPDIVTEGKLRSKRHDTHGSGTLRWLATAVAPALLSAHREGLINVREWLETHVLSELEPHDT